MPHYTPLVSTIVAGLVLAFFFGTIAQRLKVSPLAGYLLAGVAVGPFTPGFVADQGLANELAEIGVILLMFGVGLHFSLKDLLSVRAIAIPGAIVQIAVATVLGLGLSWWLGWPLAAGLVFGLALSVASTVVLLRALQERRLIKTERGKIAVGWLIVEDLAMVLALVALPALAGLNGSSGSSASLPDVVLALAITLGKVATFMALMLVVGRRVIPWILHYIAATGSRELFRLAVLGMALGVAYGAAVLFGVSFALGAFFAGMIMSESELSHRAAEETLPLRDAFAVLFFVSVGMLFDPSVLWRDPWPLVATFVIIVFGKSLAAFLIVRAFGHPRGTAFTISASLAQIGEFSFILANLGVGLGMLPEQGRDLILGGAMLSILLNPACFTLIDKLLPAPAPSLDQPQPAGTGADAHEAVEEALIKTALAQHAIVVGFGRVGRLLSKQLVRIEGLPILIVDERPELVQRARSAGFQALEGNAATAAVLNAANLTQARWLFVSVPNGFEAGQVVQQSKAISPQLEVIARAHSDAEVEHLRQKGADKIILGERELAKGMLEIALGQAAVTPPPEDGQEPRPGDGPDTPAGQNEAKPKPLAERSEPQPAGAAA